MSRLSYALLAALALHGLVLLVRTRHASESPSTVQSRAVELVEVDEQPLDEAAPVAPALAPTDAQQAPPSASLNKPSPLAVAGNAASGLAKADANDGVAEPNADGAANDGSVGAAALGSAAADSAPPPRKIDLGLDGRLFMRPPSEVGPRAHKSEFQRQLEASIATDDVQHGLARGNALLGSLNTAARASGPLRGEALVRVTVGADGSLSGVELAQGAAADWTAVLKYFRELALLKRVRVPPGARGLRVTFSVKAKVQRPSGKEVEASEVGVADPSLKPNGLTFHGDFDVADLGGGGQRLVYARVVSEEVL